MMSGRFLDAKVTFQVILFASLLLPALGTAAEIPRGVLIHFPFAVLVLAWLFGAPRFEFFSIGYDWLGIALTTLIILIPIQLVLGRGFGALAGGYIILCASIIFNLLSVIANSFENLVSVLRSISMMYKFLMISLLCEGVIVLLGGQPLLVSAFHPEYRDYMSADVPRYFGLMTNAGGLNSILIDAQVAGMVSLSSAIWFFSARRSSDITFERLPTVWAVLSLSLFIFTITATNAVLLVLAVTMWGLINFRAIPRWLFACVALLGSLIVALLAWRGAIFRRIFVETPIVNTDNGVVKLSDIHPFIDYGVWHEVSGLTIPGFYWWALTSPIRVWMEVDWISKLVGVERDFWERVYVSGDNALAVFSLQSGVIGIFVVSVAICSGYLFYLRLGRYTIKTNLLSTLGVASSMIAVLFLISAAHYSAALTNSGCIMLFSVHLALAYYSRKMFRIQ